MCVNAKKILFVASIPDFFKIFLLPYLKWFKDQGYEVHVVANTISNLPYVDKWWVVDIHRNPFKWNNFCAYKQLKRIIHKNNYAIVNCHTPVASVLTRLACINKSKDLKLIYMSHGFHFFKGASFFYWLIFYPIEVFLTRYTDAIITINNEDYEIISKNGNKKCEYYLVPGVGVDLDRFKPIDSLTKSLLREKYGYSSSITIFVYAARFSKDKNHTFIIKALSKRRELFENCKILFAGKGELEENLRDQVIKYDLSGYIDFLGFRNDIEQIYQMADFGISSSEREGLGLNLIEEMSCGLPVVATKVRGHNEFIKHGYNGFIFTKQSEEEFFNIITRIKNKDVDVKLLSNSAIEEVKRFELINSMKQITWVFNKFL